MRVDYHPRPISSFVGTAILCLAFFAVSNLIPEVEAADSKDKRKIRELKKDVRGLRRTVNQLKRQLGAANLLLSTTQVELSDTQALLAETQAELAQVLSETPFIEMVSVGNPGNDADTNGRGAIDEDFQIGIYEVTNAQYVEFLNAVAATDAHGLFNTSMQSDSRGGIRRYGEDGSYRYSAKAGMNSGMGDKPVNFVNWFDAARFCNWLHNGRPKGVQDVTTTEDGAYTLNGATSGVGIDRNAVAVFFLPSRDEWYKAAYHQPAADGGDTDDFWSYPTMSNTQPDMAAATTMGEIDPDTANIANYNRGADWDSDEDSTVEDGNVTKVGSGGPGSASHYGAFDMGGNVSEWSDTVFAGSSRILSGGAWNSLGTVMRSSSINNATPGTELEIYGFRVAKR